MLCCFCYVGLTNVWLPHGERLLSWFAGGNEGPGSQGRALVSELLLCQVKLWELLVVVHLVAYFCVLVAFVLAVCPFRLMKSLCSVWNCVFMLSNVLIWDKLSKSIGLIKGKTHSHVECAEAKLFSFLLLQTSFWMVWIPVILWFLADTNFHQMIWAQSAIVPPPHCAGALGIVTHLCHVLASLWGSESSPVMACVRVLSWSACWAVLNWAAQDSFHTREWCHRETLAGLLWRALLEVISKFPWQPPLEPDLVNPIARLIPLLLWHLYLLPCGFSDLVCFLVILPWTSSSIMNSHSQIGVWLSASS